MWDIGFRLLYLVWIVCLCVSVRVTSHYFASVALSVRGWVGAWPESSGRCGSTWVGRCMLDRDVCDGCLGV